MLIIHHCGNHVIRCLMSNIDHLLLFFYRALFQITRVFFLFCIMFVGAHIDEEGKKVNAWFVCFVACSP